MTTVSILLSNLTIETAESAINEIETGLQNKDTIIHHMFTEKRDVVRYLAECYEVLITNEKMDLEVKQIANYLVKKLAKFESNIYSTYIYDSLPAKYKSHRINPLLSDNPSNNRDINTTPDYEKENINEINFIEANISLLKLRANKLKTSHYTSLLEPETYREQFIIRNAALKMLADTLDDRKTIPLNTIHLLLAAYDTANLKHAAGEYISLLKKFGAEKKEKALSTLKVFSSKQMGKILRGHVRELHQSMEILTQEDAYENGFYGKCGCPECGSWRVNLESQYDHNTGFADPTLYCYKCGKFSPPPMVKLPISQATPRITQEKTL